MLLRPSQIKAAAEDAAAMTPAAERLQGRYASLEMPVTIFAGAGDKIVDPKAHAARLHDELPRSTFVLAPGAGHMVHHAVPGRYCGKRSSPCCVTRVRCGLRRREHLPPLTTPGVMTPPEREEQATPYETAHPIAEPSSTATLVTRALLHLLRPGN